MGIKKFFKIKPPKEATPEENREKLMELGITTKSTTRQPQNKFAAYGQFAKDRATSKIYAPPGYEDFARPKEEEDDKKDDEDDLNKSELDEKDKKKDKKKKKKHQQEDEPAAVKDPYARTEKSYKYNYDPYGSAAAEDSNGSRSGYDEFNSYGSNDLNSYNTPGKPMKPVNRAKPTFTSNPYEQAAGGYRDNSGSNSYRGTPSYGDASGSNPYNSVASNPYGGRSNPYSDMSSGYKGGSAPIPQQSQSSNNLNSSPFDNSANTYGMTKSASPNPYGASAYGSAINNDVPGVRTSTQNGTTAGSNPYTAIGGDTYLTGSRSGNVSRTNTNPYSRRKFVEPNQNNYANPDSNNVALAEEANRQTDDLDLNDAPEDANEFVFEDKYMGKTSKYTENEAALDELDLNATINERGDDLNATGYDMYQQQEIPEWQREEEAYDQLGEMQRGYKTFDEIQREEEQRQQEEEDQAVDEIKEQIRFTKQSSVASTRNTLKMAQEAEMAGMNTLGMLGNQSEKLNNVERNLDLIKIQNTAADEKVAELKKLNRNLLAVHVSNPFNSKRRRREREDMIKNRKMEDKLRAEHMSKELHQSTQRIEGALNGDNSQMSSVREKYQREKVLAASKKFQFENDEEDDEMELEIDRNLEKIQQISGRLRKLAVATGDELDSQQRRVQDIEENTDEMDIRVHLNTTRLADIK
ncbi:Protein transport protein SEC9 [Nakaseomyces bracarensis]|uniref:Protein transport protein SEC9 n=1 Tax=Nakaseomyces bracarensis TaxID=273131 RepID=A0ABR4NSB4_9SACH